MKLISLITTFIPAKPGSLIVRVFLISLGLLMSLNVFAASPESSASQEDINAAVTALQTQIDANALPPIPGVRFEAVLKLCGNSDTPQWGGACHYAIGGTGPAGGIVFYITDSGMHGLEAAPSGWYNGGNDPTVAWGCVTTTTGATGTAIGIGAQNTAKILAVCNTSGIAADLADHYALNGYTDWFLPSRDELNAMYTNIGLGAAVPNTNVGGFASDFYWSSTEYVSNLAWLQSLGSGYQYVPNKTSTFRVRAVRAF